MTVSDVTVTSFVQQPARHNHTNSGTTPPSEEGNSILDIALVILFTPVVIVSSPLLFAISIVSLPFYGIYKLFAAIFCSKTLPDETSSSRSTTSLSIEDEATELQNRSNFNHLEELAHVIDDELLPSEVSSSSSTASLNVEVIELQDGSNSNDPEEPVHVIEDKIFSHATSSSTINLNTRPTELQDGPNSSDSDPEEPVHVIEDETLSHATSSSTINLNTSPIKLQDRPSSSDSDPEEPVHVIEDKTFSHATSSSTINLNTRPTELQDGPNSSDSDPEEPVHVIEDETLSHATSSSTIKLQDRPSSSDSEEPVQTTESEPLPSEVSSSRSTIDLHIRFAEPQDGPNSSDPEEPVHITGSEPLLSEVSNSNSTFSPSIEDEVNGKITQLQAIPNFNDVQGLFRATGSEVLELCREIASYFIFRVIDGEPQAPLIPMIPNFTYQKFQQLEALAADPKADKSALIDEIKALFPNDTKSPRIQLLLLLNQISKNSIINLMHARNLAISALQPILTAQFALEEAFQSAKQLQFATSLIEYAGHIFNGEAMVRSSSSMEPLRTTFQVPVKGSSQSLVSSPSKAKKKPTRHEKEAKKLIKKLDNEDSLKTDGIFRVSQEDRSALGYATQLKRYFLSVKGKMPLISLLPASFTYEQFDKLDNLAEKPKENRAVLIGQIRKLFPADKDDVRIEFMFFLKKVLARSDFNRMSLNNLCTTPLTPALTARFQKEDPLVCLRNNLSTFLLENVDLIFNNG